MKFKIYDYENKPTEFDTGNKEIESILVKVITGDEIATVIFTDGTKKTYDSSTDRITNYFDRSYGVSKSDLDKWINYVTGTDTISYGRMQYMEGKD